MYFNAKIILRYVYFDRSLKVLSVKLLITYHGSGFIKSYQEILNCY